MFACLVNVALFVSIMYTLPGSIAANSAAQWPLLCDLLGLVSPTGRLVVRMIAGLTLVTDPPHLAFTVAEQFIYWELLAVCSDLLRRHPADLTLTYMPAGSLLPLSSNTAWRLFMSVPLHPRGLGEKPAFDESDARDFLLYAGIANLLKVMWAANSACTNLGILHTTSSADHTITGFIIAGGALTNALHPASRRRPVHESDIDIFLTGAKDAHAFARAVKIFMRLLRREFIFLPDSFIQTERSTTVNVLDRAGRSTDALQLQLCMFPYYTAFDVANFFDLCMCMLVMTADGVIMVHPRFLFALGQGSVQYLLPSRDQAAISDRRIAKYHAKYGAITIRSNEPQAAITAARRSAGLDANNVGSGTANRFCVRPSQFDMASSSALAGAVATFWYGKCHEQWATADIPADTLLEWARMAVGSGMQQRVTLSLC